MASSKQFSRPTTATKQAHRFTWPAITVAVFTAGAHAAGNDSGWYAGANAGVTHASSIAGNTDSAFASQGITSSSTADSRDQAYGFNAGYQFNRNFAVEGGYVDLGKYKFSSAVSAPGTDSASGSFKAHGLTASAVGIVPLQEGFSAYGKVGVIAATSALDAGSTGVVAVNGGSKSSVQPTFGAGVSYDFSKNVVGKLEWNRYQNLGDANVTGKNDVDAYTAGVAYRF